MATATAKAKDARTEEPKSALDVEEATRRMQLEFSVDAFERLRALKRSSGAASNAEVVRKALLLYDWVHARTREGFRVQLQNDRGEVKEIVLFV